MKFAIDWGIMMFVYWSIKWMRNVMAICRRITAEKHYIFIEYSKVGFIEWKISYILTF